MVNGLFHVKQRSEPEFPLFHVKRLSSFCIPR